MLIIFEKNIMRVIHTRTDTINQGAGLSCGISLREVISLSSLKG